ncbi:hypothetical protein [Methanosphaera cuniculi]|uniref:Uncharacterized protein n=1 Tax=Methanosphaera cuniculi TaxID=1077256 RepID=A0A2A2HG87_9EURY|nr:hypothetical protein [Methanosphaera cuniculi]PAV08310.1 hypothetical protein ASJ82_03750 [Methanosphaera cuniculi]PWL08405.1 hypothetical protein MSCUN_08440 [Methanosphaera cuniculi]
MNNENPKLLSYILDVIPYKIFDFIQNISKNIQINSKVKKIIVIIQKIKKIIILIQNIFI